MGTQYWAWVNWEDADLQPGERTLRHGSVVVRGQRGFEVERNTLIF